MKSAMRAPLFTLVLAPLLAEAAIATAIAAPPAAPAASPPTVAELAHGKRWLRLLHYKSHLFTGTHSAVDGPGFFFSPEGRRDPEKELLATIEAFRHPRPISKLPQDPACAFPARFRFLNEELRLNLPQPQCERWNEFLARFHGHESVTLIFSTAYPNNPASMFGHSFLRVNARAEPGQVKHDLLDSGLSYAAQVPDDENNFLFVFLGLTGGYRGEFSAIPYYAKVTEYNNSESRDLWEYDLNVNADETWWLLANAWEIQVNSWSDYYFFDENCSFEILTLLEVAKPEWDVASYLFHEIPGESVKKVTGVPGAVKSVKFRPSLFKKLMAYGDRLGAEEREQFHRAIRGDGLGQATVPTLDAAAQYFLYLKQQKSGKLGPEENELFQKVLSARAERRQPSPPEPAYDESSRPDLGHHASSVRLGAGRQTEGGWFEELGLKFAYHDVLNHDVGFVPYSEISFPNLTLRYFHDGGLFLQKLELLGITSLSPRSWLKNALSWRAHVTYEPPADLCSFCHVLHGAAEAGFSQAIAHDRARAYQLLGAYAEAGKPLARRWRVGPQLTVGLLANVTKDWKHQWEVSAVADPARLGSAQKLFVAAQWAQSYYLSPAWEARATAKTVWGTRDVTLTRNEVSAQILTYF